MGIHKRLRFLFTSPERGYAWIGKPNIVFGDRSPAEIMGQGSIFSWLVCMVIWTRSAAAGDRRDYRRLPATIGPASLHPTAEV
jgi:hypothetical protein